MDRIEELLAANRAHADSAPAPTAGSQPSRGVAVVTCMDCRIDVAAMLGLGEGEAHVLRNAGGVVSEDTIRSLAVSQRRLGTTAVMLIQHTQCGMEGLDEAELRAELEAGAGATPPFGLGSFADLEASVRDGVRNLRASPFLPHRGEVRGFVYDVATRRLREVET